MFHLLHKHACVVFLPYVEQGLCGLCYGEYLRLRGSSRRLNRVDVLKCASQPKNIRVDALLNIALPNRNEQASPTGNVCGSSYDSLRRVSVITRPKGRVAHETKKVKRLVMLHKKASGEVVCMRQS
eukprot:1247371-Amphidinium_carterae.2